MQTGLIKERRDKRFLLYSVLIVVASGCFFLIGNLIPALFSIVYWMIGIPFLGYLQDKYDDFLHPVAPLIVLVYLYSIASILFYYGSSGFTAHGDAISGRSFIIFCVACLLGESGIILGGYLALRQKITAGTSYKLDKNVGKRAIYVMLFLSAVIGYVFFNQVIGFFDFIHPKAYGETALSSRVEMMEAGASAPIRQIITQIVPLVLLTASGIYLAFKSNILFRFIGLALLAANIFTFILSGSRGGLFGTLTMVAIFFHYRVKRIRLLSMVLGVVVSILLLNTIGLARSTANLGEMIDIIAFEAKEKSTNLLNITTSSELIVGLNLMKLIEAISSGESRYNYGKGFLDDVMCYVPRVIYPDRPLPLSERFIEEFYPGIRDIGGGYGLFFLQDGYWAFGLIGVLLSLIAYSWALSKIYIYMKNYFDSDFMVLIYSAVYFTLVISSPRSGLLLSFKNAAIGAIPLLIVLGLSSIRFRFTGNRVD